METSFWNNQSQTKDLTSYRNTFYKIRAPTKDDQDDGVWRVCTSNMLFPFGTLTLYTCAHINKNDTDCQKTADLTVSRFVVLRF